MNIYFLICFCHPLSECYIFQGYDIRRKGRDDGEGARKQRERARESEREREREEERERERARERERERESTKMKGVVGGR